MNTQQPSLADICRVVEDAFGLTPESQARREAAERDMERRIQLRRDSMRVKAVAACKQAIGKKFAVKAKDGFTYKGVIDTAEVKEVTVRRTSGGGAAIEVWISIDMLCGEAKSRKNFVVNTLPR